MIVNTDQDNETNGYLVHPHCSYDYCFPPSPPVQINLTIEGGADAQCALIVLVYYVVLVSRISA